MDKSNASILFSLLSGVALFLFIAYSAVRTLDSSKPDNYFAVSQGVDFHDGILNAPTQTSYAQYEQSDVSIPEYSPDNASYAASGIDKSSEGHGSGYTNSSGGTGSTNKSGGSNESNSGVTVLAMNSRNREDAAADAAGTTTSSLTSDGSLTSTATRQAAAGTNAHGGRDPGGKNPHNSIPVGDGLLFLLLLTGIYALWKSAANIKQQLTTNYFNSFSLKNKNVRA
jgi:cytoskeletal protein RodZ